MKTLLLPLWFLCDFSTKYKGVEKHMQTKIVKIPQCTAQQAKEFDVAGGDITVYTAGAARYRTTEEIAGEYVCRLPNVIGIGNALSTDTVKMFDSPFVSANNHIAVVRDEEIILPKILFNILKYAVGIESRFRGTALKTACMDEILRIEIPVPPMQWQLKMADFIGQTERDAERIQSQIDLLDNQIKELINNPYQNK